MLYTRRSVSSGYPNTEMFAEGKAEVFRQSLRWKQLTPVSRPLPSHRFDAKVLVPIKDEIYVTGLKILGNALFYVTHKV